MTELCCCSLKSFDVARKSHGTDEDLLFLHFDLDNNPLTDSDNQAPALDSSSHF